jgi:hypothetical protein
VLDEEWMRNIMTKVTVDCAWADSILTEIASETTAPEHAGQLTAAFVGGIAGIIALKTPPGRPSDSFFGLVSVDSNGASLSQEFLDRQPRYRLWQSVIQLLNGDTDAAWTILRTAGEADDMRALLMMEAGRMWHELSHDLSDETGLS